jgi:hypothetical protein
MDNVVITLPVLLNEWINNDLLMRKHFLVWQNKDLASGYVKPEWAGEIYHDCRWPKLRLNGHPGNGAPGISKDAMAAKIYDDRISVVFVDHDIYKFQAVHPMFFQKLRGHLYDMHNRHHTSCGEYLR